MEIKVLAVSEPKVVTKGKGTWNEIVVTYEGKKGETERKIRSFSEVDAYTAFTELDDIVYGSFPLTADITVKKEGDFWVWKGATFSFLKEAQNVEAAVNEPKSTASAGAYKTTKATGTWETHEERAAKQRYIVRQSSITAALGYLSSVPLIAEGWTVEQVLDIARRFEAFVFEENQTAKPQVAAVKKAGRPRKEIAVVDSDPIE